MGEKDKQEQTYRLPGVQAEDGSTGTLVFTVKPGGNAHAEFQADEQPTPEQLPAQPEQAGPPTPGQLPAQEAPPTAQQQPAETPAGAQSAPTPPPGT